MEALNQAYKQKECLHKFHSVYYGSEWVVECEKCQKDIYDLYSKEDANKIVDSLLIITNHQKYNFHNIETPQEMYDEDKQWNPKEPKDDFYGCIIEIIFVVAIILIFKYLL